MAPAGSCRAAQKDLASIPRGEGGVGHTDLRPATCNGSISSGPRNGRRCCSARTERIRGGAGRTSAFSLTFLPRNLSCAGFFFLPWTCAFGRLGVNLTINKMPPTVRDKAGNECSPSQATVTCSRVRLFDGTRDVAPSESCASLVRAGRGNSLCMIRLCAVASKTFLNPNAYQAAYKRPELTRRE